MLSSKSQTKRIKKKGDLMSNSRKEKSFIVRVKAGDLLNLLNEAKKDQNLGRCINLFADYDPETEIVIQLTDKTGEK